MPFNHNLHYDWEGYFVGFREKDGVLLMKFSKHSFELISSVKLLQYNVSAYFEKYIYFYHTKDKKIKRLAIESLNVSDLGGHLFPQISWGSSDCFHNVETKKYEVYDKDDQKVFEFKYEAPIATKFIPSGILIFQNTEKESNWIKCLDPNGGHEKWIKEFPWQFVRLEEYKGLLVLEYQAYDNIRNDEGYEGERDWYNPNSFTIVLDAETGEERWRKELTYSKIDWENGVVLIGNKKVWEVDIESGEVKTEATVAPEYDLGYYPHFVDEEGIYYTMHAGSFGKIGKADGRILWEFDLIDKAGEKRKLSNWLLLGNGKLVLQALPNHPNGDLMCIFDPGENMEYSNIRNGNRFNPG